MVLTPIERLPTVLARTWFYLSLAIFFAIGWLAPEVGVWIKDAGITPWLVILAFFSNGLTLSTTALIGNLHQWSLLVLAMVVTFLLPALVVLLVRQFMSEGQTPLAAGFQLLAVVPTTLVSAVVLTRVAGGNGAMALYITVLANLLAIVIVPLLMQWTLGMENARLDVVGTSLGMVYTVLLPTLAGQITRRYVRAWAIRYTKPLNILAQLTILIFITTGMAQLQRDLLSPMLLLGVFIACVALHLLLLVAGNAGGRLLRADVPGQRALALSTSQKSLVVAVFLWDRLLMPLGPAYGIAVLPLIVYYIIQLVIDSALAQWWGQRPAQAEQATAVTVAD